ncbi:MAG TPA: glycine zipper domain-containing protein [Ferruginibacter sp.]|nr:glycine zipper domain-containing protein [Ferruginibacter sp.]HRE62476.1 glycine zipper domain-containing protein [Ferruginibacter sp.]
MKHILLPLAITSVVLFTACSQKKDTAARDMILLTDSIHTSNLTTDSAAGQAIAQPQEPVEAAPPARTNVQGKNRTKPRPVYNNNATTQAPVATPEPSQPTVTPTPAPAPSAETAGTGSNNEGNSSEGNTTATPAKKKGVSNSAKGAIIGGVGGAVAGAVIGKNAKGAVIGGVVGAAGGYILGKKKDKKQSDTSNN